MENENGGSAPVDNDNDDNNPTLHSTYSIKSRYYYNPEDELVSALVENFSANQYLQLTDLSLRRVATWWQSNAFQLLSAPDRQNPTPEEADAE